LQNSNDKQLIVSYLLGELKEAAKEQFEKRYFTDDLLFDQLEATEHDLIEDYLHSRLPEAQKKQFEDRLRANPHTREKVEFIRALQNRLKLIRRESLLQRVWSSVAFRRQRLAVALAFALLLTMGVLASIFVENRNLRRQLETYTATSGGRVALPPEPLVSAFVDHLQLDATELKRGAGRGDIGSAQIFRLRKRAAAVEIALNFRPSDASEFYTAVLVDADGVERASHSQLSPTILDGMGRVTAVFAAAHLPQGSYIIRLKNSRGLTVESFPFSVRVE